MTAASKTTKTVGKSIGKPAKAKPAAKKIAKPKPPLTMNLTTGKIAVKKVKTPAALTPAQTAARAKRDARFPAEAKAAAEKAIAKTQPKPPKIVAPKVEFIVKARVKGAPIHVITPDARPSGGAKLSAHTHAAMSLLGMFGDKRPKASERALITMIGGRAVTHHLKENNIVRSGDDTVQFTPAGLGKFRARSIDNALANGFTDMFMTGKVSAAIDVPKGKVFAAEI